MATRAFDIRDARSEFAYKTCKAEINFIENNETLSSVEGENTVLKMLQGRFQFASERRTLLNAMIEKQQKATKGRLIKKSSTKSKSVVASQKTEVVADPIVAEDDVIASI